MGGSTGGTCPLQTHGKFFKRDDKLLCSLIQDTEYCSCCAFFYYHFLPVCITIHFYPSSGEEHGGAPFIAFSGHLLRFRRLLKAYLFD